jgi:hypothetical protein
VHTQTEWVPHSSAKVQCCVMWFSRFLKLYEFSDVTLDMNNLYISFEFPSRRITGCVIPYVVHVVSEESK